MTTYRFPEIKVSRRRTGSCPVCGKRVTRTRQFSMTVNPFNRRADGIPKTVEEVRADVVAEADAWQPDPEVFIHQACAESDRS